MLWFTGLWNLSAMAPANMTISSPGVPSSTAKAVVDDSVFEGLVFPIVIVIVVAMVVTMIIMMLACSSKPSKRSRRSSSARTTIRARRSSGCVRFPQCRRY